MLYLNNLIKFVHILALKNTIKILYAIIFIKEENLSQKLKFPLFFDNILNIYTFLICEIYQIIIIHFVFYFEFSFTNRHFSTLKST